MKASARVARIIALALAASACSPATPASTSPGASPTGAIATVTSDDGALTLDIPPSALPAGVTVNQLSARKLPVPDSDPEAGGLFAAYELLPNGITFQSPVDFHLTLAGHAETLPIVSLTSDAKTEPALRDLQINIDTSLNETRVDGKLAHFSFVLVAYGLFLVRLNDQGTHLLRDTFLERIDVNRARMPGVVLTVPSASGPDTIATLPWTLADGSTALRGFYVKTSFDNWAVTNGKWVTTGGGVLSPEGVDNAPASAKERGGTVGIDQQFQCVNIGLADISHQAHVEFNQEMYAFPVPAGADRFYVPPDSALEPIESKSWATKQFYNITTNVKCVSSTPVPGITPTPYPTPPTPLTPLTTPPPTPTYVTAPPSETALNISNYSQGSKFHDCVFTVTVVWAPSPGEPPTLTGDGTIVIEGPTDAGTQIVTAANNQISLPLTFRSKSTAQSWTVTLTSVDGVPVAPAPEGAAGSQYSYNAPGDPRC